VICLTATSRPRSRSRAAADRGELAGSDRVEYLVTQVRFHFGSLVCQYLKDQSFQFQVMIAAAGNAFFQAILRPTPGGPAPRFRVQQVEHLLVIAPFGLEVLVDMGLLGRAEQALIWEQFAPRGIAEELRIWMSAMAFFLPGWCSPDHHCR